MLTVLNFTKMHGLGNDYIYINCLDTEIEDPEKLSIQLSDRHFGVGGDGLVLIMRSTSADFRMRMFNADGSEAQMCGNAIRCVGKYLYDNNHTSNKVISVETLAGIMRLELTVDDNTVSGVRVDMGEPVLNPNLIPLNTDLTDSNSIKLEIQGQEFQAFCVSMGNPHAVIFVDEITDHHVLTLGPIIENHPMFPERVNVEFVKIVDNSNLIMRVWERGSGETLACGTGAAAVCVAAHANKGLNPKVNISLKGGELQLEWDEETNRVFKTGPATFVFDGSIDLSNLKE